MTEKWRIDELAYRSGVSVDTIRFYQRDGLLPPSQREGRAAVYGLAHLRRLEQIRDLQARHFSLGAVKALLAESRLEAIQAMFSVDEGMLSRDQLVTSSGVNPEVIDQVEAVGLLMDPAESGRTGYDRADVEALAAVRRLLELGMPPEVVVFLARLYAEHFSSMQDQVAALFQGDGPLEWEEASRNAFIGGLGERVGEVFELTAQLLNYAHRATVRRMTLQTPVPDDKV
ncbi:MAG TPA: MerR family transcriptional regulator [Acidimicrobiales bacterium]|nr:MerR family transcriptional regulator [Acidimicrobiales bacterium]